VIVDPEYLRIQARRGLAKGWRAEQRRDGDLRCAGAPGETGRAALVHGQIGRGVQGRDGEAREGLMEWGIRSVGSVYWQAAELMKPHTGTTNSIKKAGESYCRCARNVDAEQTLTVFLKMETWKHHYNVKQAIYSPRNYEPKFRTASRRARRAFFTN
jgi:hypothetical protein